MFYKEINSVCYSELYSFLSGSLNRIIVAFKTINLSCLFFILIIALQFLKKRSFNLIFKQDWYTPLSLWLHKSTSSYGTNWLRAFLCIIGVGAVTYFAYAVSLPEIKFGFRYFTNDNLSFHIRYFFEFLLPVHKMTLIDHTNPTGLSALFDILGRIFISFLIYQTIAAFRRFGIK